MNHGQWARENTLYALVSAFKQVRTAEKKTMPFLSPQADGGAIIERFYAAMRWPRGPDVPAFQWRNQ